MVKSQYSEVFCAEWDDTTASDMPSLPRRRVLAWSSLKKDRIYAAAFFGGIGIILGCFGFTYWLALHDKPCKEWQMERCDKTAITKWFVHRIYGVGELQSGVGTVNQIGFLLVCFSLYHLGEMTIWPALQDQEMTLDQVNTYISASHGSLLSALTGARYIRSSVAVKTIICTTVLAVLVLANQVIVGQAYALRYRNETYNAPINTGGQLHINYKASDITPPIPGAVRGAGTIYNSWAYKYAKEPLPDLRHYIFDREDMSATGGNFTIGAVRVERTITCRDFPLGDRIASVNPDKETFKVATNLTNKGTPGVGSVQVRLVPRTGVWVDGFELVNEKRTITQLVLAALNGTIEDSTPSRIPNTTHDVSAVRCAVDITLKDDVIRRGPSNDPKRPVNVTTLAQIVGPTAGPFEPSMHLANLAAWFGAVPTTCGLVVQNSVPMFQFMKDDTDYTDAPGLPRIFASSEDFTTAGDAWRTSDIKHFINITSGALGITLTRFFPDHIRQPVPCHESVARILPQRAYFMLLPVAVIVPVALGLLWLCASSYESTGIPEPMGATVTDILVNGKTLLVGDAMKPNELDGINKEMRVRFKQLDKGYSLYQST